MNARRDLDPLPLPAKRSTGDRYARDNSIAGTTRAAQETPCRRRHAAAVRHADDLDRRGRHAQGAHAQRQGRGRQPQFLVRQHQRAEEHRRFRSPERQVTALIGPSGCGKSTFLRCFNRMHDLQPETRYEGSITLHPDNINLVGPGVDPIEVRMRIGMVFQKPNPFPKSIFENVAYGLRAARRAQPRRRLAEEVERRCAARRCGTRSRIACRIRRSALSGGQMQRLCIARALATTPEILLFDEPTSALDPIATAKIEELIYDAARPASRSLIVTHNMQQAARVSDYTAVHVPRRADRVRREPRRSSRTRARRRPKTTSRAATAECGGTPQRPIRPKATRRRRVRSALVGAAAARGRRWAASSSIRSSTAVRALLDGDAPARARSCWPAKSQVNDLERHGRSRSVPSSIALHQPVAGDLRMATGRVAHHGRARSASATKPKKIARFAGRLATRRAAGPVRAVARYPASTWPSSPPACCATQCVRSTKPMPIWRARRRARRFGARRGVRRGAAPAADARDAGPALPQRDDRHGVRAQGPRAHRRPREEYRRAGACFVRAASRHQKTGDAVIRKRTSGQSITSRSSSLIPIFGASVHRRASR